MKNLNKANVKRLLLLSLKHEMQFSSPWAGQEYNAGRISGLTTALRLMSEHDGDKKFEEELEKDLAEVLLPPLEL